MPRVVSLIAAVFSVRVVIGSPAITSGWLVFLERSVLCVVKVRKVVEAITVSTWLWQLIIQSHTYKAKVIARTIRLTPDKKSDKEFLID